MFYFEPSRAIILGALGAGIAVPIVLGVVQGFALTRVVDKSLMKMPRVFMTYDSVITFTVALTAGLTAAVVRLFTGLVSAYVKLCNVREL